MFNWFTQLLFERTPNDWCKQSLTWVLWWFSGCKMICLLKYDVLCLHLLSWETNTSYSNGPSSIIILPLTGNLKDIVEGLFNWFTLGIIWKIRVRIYKLSYLDSVFHKICYTMFTYPLMELQCILLQWFEFSNHPPIDW